MPDDRKLQVWLKAKGLAVATYQAVSNSGIAKDLVSDSEEVSRMLYALKARIRHE